MQTIEFPDDADGDALRRVASDGSDMSRPMLIDFMVEASTQHDAEAIARIGEQRGYTAQIAEDDGCWTVYLAVTMLASHEGVVARQREISSFVSPFGTQCESWGTFGNVESP